MEGVISYRPRMGKLKLESLVKAKLRYKSVNQFIDHAVAKALREEFGRNPLAKRIADAAHQAAADHAPLQFVKPASQESEEIEAAAQGALGPGSLVPATEILKPHKNRKAN